MPISQQIHDKSGLGKLNALQYINMASKLSWGHNCLLASQEIDTYW